MREAGGRVHAQVSTQAPRIADLVAKEKPGEPVTVYATYASLERIVQAHRLHGLPAWDLVVVDEAHRTAGSDGKPWPAVHADDQVPEKRRLYFTATPRIVDEGRVPREVVDVAEGTVICSMDDERIYGKTVFTWTLRQGIEHGYLADCRVLVPVVTDEDLREILRLPAVADLRSQRTNEELLRLALQIAEEGEECCIICNSRLLSEGIDVAAVDAIVFADPKSSVIDIVQAVGRALRQSYRQGKVSWIIIPVYLPTPEVGDDTATAHPAEVHDAGEAVKAEADAEIEASSFRTIWRVLRALAAHDAPGGRPDHRAARPPLAGHRAHL
ncbi:helicase-related protein [Kitasatospora sp. NPDC094028]